MPFVPVAETAQVNMRFRGPNNQVCENTLYVRRGGGWNISQLEQLAIECADWHLDEYRAQQSNQVALFNVLCRSIEDAIAPVFDFLLITPQAGTQVSAAMPMHTTWVIKFLSGVTGRSFRGRNYVVGLSEAAVAGDFILQASADDWKDIYEDFGARMTAESWEHVIVSRFTDGAPRITGVATPVLNYGYTDLRVDTQRRRLIDVSN